MTDAELQLAAEKEPEAEGINGVGCEREEGGSRTVGCEREEEVEGCCSVSCGKKLLNNGEEGECACGGHGFSQRIRRQTLNPEL